MIVYLDTSTVLRVVLGQPEALIEWGQWQRAYSSELMGIEARRTFDRLRLEGALDDRDLAEAHQRLRRIERGVGVVRLARTVFERASAPMRTAVKTLDALHLVSAQLYREQRGEPIVFATHDQQQALGALAMELDVIGVWG